MVLPLSITGSVILYVVTFYRSSVALNSRTRSKFARMVLASVLPFIIAGLRYNVGWDYGSYVWGFELFDPSISVYDIFTTRGFGDSIGLDLVLLFTKSLNSRFLFLAVTSFLCYGPAFLYLIDEWDDDKRIIKLSAFVTCFTLLFTGYSAIKQGIAISFCLYSLKYVSRRKPFGFIVCLIIAYLFHSTAIVFFPVYFLWNYRKKMPWWGKFLSIGVAFAIVVFFEPIVGTLGGDRFSSYGTQLLQTNNYLFLLMLAWLTIYLYFRKLLVALDKRNELLILLYAVGTILMLIGYRNAFAKRIAYYFRPVEIVLLPQLSFAFTDRSRKIVDVMIALYVVAILVLTESGTAMDMAPLPYSFIFGK